MLKVRYPGVPVMALTATATERVQRKSLRFNAILSANNYSRHQGAAQAKRLRYVFSKL